MGGDGVSHRKSSQLASSPHPHGWGEGSRRARELHRGRSCRAARGKLKIARPMSGIWLTALSIRRARSASDSSRNVSHGSRFGVSPWRPCKAVEFDGLPSVKVTQGEDSMTLSISNVSSLPPFTKHGISPPRSLESPCRATDERAHHLGRKAPVDRTVLFVELSELVGRNPRGVETAVTDLILDATNLILSLEMVCLARERHLK